MLGCPLDPDVRGNEVIHRNVSLPNCDLADFDTWLSLGTKHDELPSDAFEHFSVVLHHSIATIDIAGTAMWTLRVDFRVDRTVFNARDWDFLARRKHALPLFPDVVDIRLRTRFGHPHGGAAKEAHQWARDSPQRWSAAEPNRHRNEPHEKPL